jgi:hypothetical protein
VTAATILVATWRDGVFALRADECTHELARHSVNGLAPDGDGGALAIVDGRSLQQRAADGAWRTLVTADCDLACCVAVGSEIFIGTDGARVLCLDADGALAPLPGFDAVAGRSDWYPGQALVDGELVGPPLGVRSITATADRRVLLANVHVGGIPRSTDGGRTWQPTIDLNYDIHEVRAHPADPSIVVAAAAIGLCMSRDAGRTWHVERDGLHAPYCSAVGLAGGAVLVGAAAEHFDPAGAVYRRLLGGDAQLTEIGGGLPHRVGGIVDTGQIAAHRDTVAISDRNGNVYASSNAGTTWAPIATGLPPPSCVLVV